MNKRGFTLIELLATITIMALIATMASFSISHAYDQKQDIIDKNTEEIITNAACVFIELENNKDLKNKCLSESCDIPIKLIMKSGLLYEQDVDNSIVIHIEKENNTKKCTIK